MGLTSPRQFLAPALALGFVWRLWIFLAALVSVVLGYKSHFFDPSEGRVVFRLLEFLAAEVMVVGLAAGLLVLGIASWVSRATRPLGEA
jgi:polyferredoxin